MRAADAGPARPWVLWGALGDTEDRSWRQLVPGAGSASCLLARDAREEGSSTVTERHEGRVGPP